MKQLFNFTLIITLLMVNTEVLYAQVELTPEEVITIIKNKGHYKNYSLVAAHRGYWMDYPENSLPAYKMATMAGADIVEMDVRLTSDARMIVMHDACLDRVTTGYGKVSQRNWAYISSLDLRLLNGTPTKEKMLLLSEAIDYLKGRAVISIDIKETGKTFNDVFLRVVEMCKAKGVLSQTIIKGKLPYSELMKLLSQAKVTLDDFIYTPIAFDNTQNLDQYINDFVNSKKIYAIELVYKQSTSKTLKYVPLLNKNNIWIGQYSFWPETRYGVFAEKNPLVDCDPIARDYIFRDKDPNNPLDDGRGDWDWLIPLGADYIITDRCELLIEYLKTLNKRSL